MISRHTPQTGRGCGAGRGSWSVWEYPYALWCVVLTAWPVPTRGLLETPPLPLRAEIGPWGGSIRRIS